MEYKDILAEDLREVINEHLRAHHKPPRVPELAEMLGITTVEVAKLFMHYRIRINVINDHRAGEGTGRVVQPHKPWWDYITVCTRPFREVESLYHAVSDPEVKVLSITVNSSSELLIKLTHLDGRIALFELDTDLENGLSRPRQDFVRPLIKLVSRKNQDLGRTLFGIWSYHLENENDLERIDSA
jgi:hypothetical protein